ncbi:MAG TPA: LON peptidase substrate-binding domain-containing protein [Tepidiformaceae bacterium]|nr:LON peptidase substrate-binding domain-containing protein [Tepidiformaceae bacterium]
MPLFPLRTVLFPGMPLPLRIFEERYKTMTKELLESGGEFGVLLIREGNEVGGAARPYDVGTLARIEESTEMQGGRYVLQARGTRRFRLRRMLAPRPYPYGEIELIDDRDEPPSMPLRAALETVRVTFPLYFRLALSLTDQWAQGLTLPDEPHALVNFLGPWLQIEEEAKQRLLELEGAQERVAHLAEILDDLLLQTRDQVDEHRRSKFNALGSGN